MKRNLLILAAAVCIVTAVYAASTQIKITAAGAQVGTSRSQAIGFWGVTPTTQLVVYSGGIDLTNLTALLIELQRTGIIRTN